MAALIAQSENNQTGKISRIFKLWNSVPFPQCNFYPLQVISFERSKGVVNKYNLKGGGGIVPLPF